MQVKVTKKPKSTLEINIIVPKVKVREAYADVLKEEVTKANLPGFRKGQAPESLVKENLNVSDLHGEIVNVLLKTFYPQALKENKITAISNPKVEIKEFDVEKDFEFTATVATKPEFTIKPFEKELKKLYKEKQKDGEEKVALAPNEVVDVLIKKADLEAPEPLIEEEIERMLMRVIDQTQQLGMSIEDYLKAQNKTVEQLREDYRTNAETNIKAEFVLQYLIDERKIDVAEKEIEEAIKAVGDPEVQKQMQTPMQKWYIKSVLAKNKLLSQIIEETEKK